MKNKIVLLFIVACVAFVFFMMNHHEVYFEELSLEKTEKVIPEDIREMISEQVILFGVQGEFEKSLELYELEGHQFLDDQHIKLYRVQIDYAWLDNIVIFKNGVYQNMISSMSFNHLYIADHDSDGHFELMVQGALGSGMYYNQLTWYDLELNTLISNVFYNDNKAIELLVVDNKIQAFTYDFNMKRRFTNPIGEVHFGAEISIDNLESKYFKLDE